MKGKCDSHKQKIQKQPGRGWRRHSTPKTMSRPKQKQKYATDEARDRVQHNIMNDDKQIKNRRRC